MRRHAGGRSSARARSPMACAWSALHRGGEGMPTLSHRGCHRPSRPTFAPPRTPVLQTGARGQSPRLGGLLESLFAASQSSSTAPPGLCRLLMVKPHPPQGIAGACDAADAPRFDHKKVTKLDLILGECIRAGRKCKSTLFRPAGRLGGGGALGPMPRP